MILGQLYRSRRMSTWWIQAAMTLAAFPASPLPDLADLQSPCSCYLRTCHSKGQHPFTFLFVCIVTPEEQGLWIQILHFKCPVQYPIHCMYLIKKQKNRTRHKASLSLCSLPVTTPPSQLKSHEKGLAEAYSWGQNQTCALQYTPPESGLLRRCLHLQDTFHRKAKENAAQERGFKGPCCALDQRP